MTRVLISDQNILDEGASTSHLSDDKNVNTEVDVEVDEEDVGTDGVSSEGEKSAGQDGIQVSNISSQPFSNIESCKVFDNFCKINEKLQQFCLL